MPRYQRFEELPAWKESSLLLQAVLDLGELPQPPLPAGTRSHLERCAVVLSGRIAIVFETYGIHRQLDRLGEARELSLEILAAVQAVGDRPRCRAAAPQMDAIRKHAEACGRQLGAWMTAVGKNASQARGDGEEGGRGRPEPKSDRTEDHGTRPEPSARTVPNRNRNAAPDRVSGRPRVEGA